MTPDLQLALWDTATLAGLATAGHLTAGRIRPSAASQAAASLAVGVMLLVATGAALLLTASVLQTPIPAGLLPVGVIAVAAASGFRREGRAVLPAAGITFLIAAAASLPLALIVRLRDTTQVFTDTIAFMAGAGTIAAGRADLLPVEATTFYSFPPASKIQHTIGFLYDPASYTSIHAGDGGVRTLGIALLAAVAVLIGSAVRQQLAGASPLRGRLTAMAAAAVLLTMERAVSIAHLNGSHSGVAAAMLLLAILLAAGHENRGLTGGEMTAAILAVAALPLHRAEGLLLAGIMLLPAHRLNIPKEQLARLWQTLGLTVALWSTATLLPYLRAGRVAVSWAGNPVQTLYIMIGAAAAVYLVGTLSRSMPDKVHRLVQPAGELLIVGGPVVYTIAGGGSVARSVDATMRNLLPVYGETAAAGWRWSGFVVIGLILVAVLVRLGRPTGGLAAFLWPAYLFLPAMLLAGVVREGAYRVGFPDSLNRSWLHALPLLIVAVAAAPVVLSARLGATVPATGLVEGSGSPRPA